MSIKQQLRQFQEIIAWYSVLAPVGFSLLYYFYPTISVLRYFYPTNLVEIPFDVFEICLETVCTSVILLTIATRLAGLRVTTRSWIGTSASAVILTLLWLTPVKGSSNSKTGSVNNYVTSIG